MVNSKRFELILTDDNKRPVRSLRLIAGSTNTVLLGGSADQGDHVTQQPISDQAFVGVMRVIKDHPELFHIHEIFLPEPYRDKEGYMATIYFCDGERKMEVTCRHLEACRGQKDRCPQGDLLLKLIDKIRDILTEEGIDAHFFSLEG